MDNKVLVRLTIVGIDETFDMFLPVNELVWKIKKLILKSVSDLTGYIFNLNDDYTLLNRKTSQIYSSNTTIIETDIRNDTELLLLQKI